MCGFAGFLQTGSIVAAEAMAVTARRMADTLSHRGPDDAGTWADPAAGIALGHRRLSIIDLSPEGHQPMASPSGRYVIAYNGEVYNFESLRRELDREGFRWRGHSDTEVMLAAFEKWGVVGALERFNGMFAFALWDRAERMLHLARDRMGEKPLYYGWAGNTLLFGSELKALRAHPAWASRISRDALAAYLRYNYVPAPYSIYEGISKLPAAHYLSISAARAGDPQPYWSLRTVAESGHADPIDRSDADAIEELDTLLRDAVRIRTVADVPVGVFLSGGIDSSTVVALMQAQAAGPVKSFSIGFAEAEYNEAQHAKAVATHLGTDHTELYVTPEEAMSVIPSLPDTYDEPFADSSQVPTVLVSKLARSKVTVTLSGDGGDELFCGYTRYFLGRRVWNTIGRVPRPVRTFAGRALTSLSPNSWNTVVGNVARVVPSARAITGHRLHKLAEVLGVPSADIMYQGLVSHWSEPESIVHASREPRTAVMDPEQWADLNDFTARMMYLDALTYLPDDILVKVDRASMSVSLEARVPLLDHRVVEYAWRLPLTMKLRNDQGKWLLRQVLYRYVPKHLIERPKMGFGVPIDHWLRGPLRGWAEDLLNEKKLEAGGHFQVAAIREKWAEHLSGARNWQYWLWDILMFQAWLDLQSTSSASR
ncbi:MAG TPA: asparagine synthase (glutamine-hydrolyzing) [Thermoanaerobaculia bacterium]|nr:asparagine synthase (glutamine-hydrolyzing) [Thermoanaerobaculia bacterium]